MSGVPASVTAMSQVLDPPLTDQVTAALDALTAAVDALVAATVPTGSSTPGTTASLWTLSAPALVAATAALHRQSCRVDAAMHALVREVDARGAAVEAGAATTAAWLSGRLRLHPGAAKRLVATARGLHDDPAGPLVHHAQEGADSAGGVGRWRLREAFAAGDVSGEHASTACETLAAVRDLPGVDAGIEDQAEQFLVDHARDHHPQALSRLARHLLHRLDPDAGDRLGREESHATATQHLEIRSRKDGGADVAGRFGPELTAALRAQLEPLAAPRPSSEGGRDLRTLGQRQADALAELLRRYAGAELGATRHGARATVTVTMALETLERRLGAAGAWLTWSGPVSAETARRLACDAQVIPVVLGGTSEPLDVGRASYPVTQAIWRALVARDGGCAFAGCDRPIEWCEAHHRIHWEDGGPTSVENCCLLCDHHHRAVHHHGWALELRDGQIWTIPPPWVDPHQTPRPNTPRARLLDARGAPRAPDG